MSEEKQIRAEAATFRRLLSHLDNRKDVQNIDLMNLAGFCRNCLSKWYATAAADVDFDLSIDEAKELIYKMPYADWKEKYQIPMNHSSLQEESSLKDRNQSL